MEFGDIPLDRAEGAVLAHSVRQGKIAFKKGRVLSIDDVNALRTAGIEKIIGSRLESGDVPEDDAAREVAEAARGPGARRAEAFTGRCNLYAEAAGVVILDRARVDRLNLVDEAITLATLPPFDLVEKGQMLATVKIIPFATPRAALDRAKAIAKDGGPLLRVAPLKAHPVGLVMTTLPGTKPNVLDKTVTVLRDRLATLGSDVTGEIRCNHDAASVATAIRELLGKGCAPILVYGASAIVDRRDVIPAGIIAAGGVVDHFGMPVDPGNLLLMGHAGDVPVVGLPGCARSPKLNGFDWVLWRLMADVPVTRTDIMTLGAGGLLKEIPSRPQLRDPEAAGDDSESEGPQRMPRIAAVVMAAGQSRRMGTRNKLLIPVDGVPMVVRAVDTALASEAGPVIVVTGHQADDVKAALKGRHVTFTHNPDYAEGMSTSLRVAVKALPADADGVLILLGDMPRIRPDHLNRLVAAFNPVEGRAIILPTANGKRGNPAVFARRFFKDMQEVSGDMGARQIISEHGDQVCEVALDDPAIFLDVDTPEALAALTKN